MYVLECKIHYHKLLIWHTDTHTLAIGAERAGVPCTNLHERQTRYPAYGAGPVREFTDYGTRARARTPPSASYSKEMLPHARVHTHTRHKYMPCVARRTSVYFVDVLYLLRLVGINCVVTNLLTEICCVCLYVLLVCCLRSCFNHRVSCDACAGAGYWYTAVCKCKYVFSSLFVLPYTSPFSASNMYI